MKTNISFSNTSFTGEKSVNEIIPNMLLLQSWFSNFETFSFNGPSWSISVEYYLYILFGVALFYTQRLILGFIFLFFIIGAYLLVFDSTYLKIEALRGIASFFAGGFLYFFYKRFILGIKLPYFYASVAEALSLFLIIYAVTFNLDSIYLIAIFSIVIIVFSAEGGLFSGIFKNRPFVRLGDYSYSIYLVHAAVILCLSFVHLLLKDKAVSFIGNGVLSDIFSNLYVIIILALVCVISHFTYTYIEITGQKIGRKIIKTGSKNE
jgi:peptidoglycan/LPS O-acetylase OafA/YrhL